MRQSESVECLMSTKRWKKKKQLLDEECDKV